MLETEITHQRRRNGTAFEGIRAVGIIGDHRHELVAVFHLSLFIDDSDAVRVANTGATFADRNAGTGKTVTLNGVYNNVQFYGVVKAGGAALASGDIATGNRAVAIFNAQAGTPRWELQNPQTGGGGGGTSLGNTAFGIPEESCGTGVRYARTF